MKFLDLCSIDNLNNIDLSTTLWKCGFHTDLIRRGDGWVVVNFASSVVTAKDHGPGHHLVGQKKTADTNDYEWQNESEH